MALEMGAVKHKVIVLDGLDFLWDRPELNELAFLWKKNFSVYYMAEYFERDPDEILLALLHLSRSGRIERRPGGLLG